jgi:hypothetical protein
VPGTKYHIEIPFEGDARLFRHFPSTRTLEHPHATLRDRELIISLVLYHSNDADEINREIDKTVSSIKQFLEWQRPQVEACNRQMRDSTRTKIEERKARILQSRNIAASLRYPLRRRADGPLTYISSEVRRTIAPTRNRAPAGHQPFIPEPTIDEAEYQHILKVMGDMAIMMERSPKTFAELEEEEIRDFFLLVLNGHYEGSATGETFNASGKTDILVRDGNRNVFIGECKIWRGSKQFIEAIDQLLGYLTWRDTKSAILVFSRNKDFTGVIDTIKAAAEQHPHKKRGPVTQGETRFRYTFGNPEDHDREIIVTVMAFSVLPPQAALSQPQGG